MRIIPGIAVSLILAFCVACEKAPLPEAFPSLSLATVILTTKSGPHAVSVEVAKTDEERAKGLMFRESLPENGGMWFVFPHEVIDPFWMKNTPLSLDIIFVGKDFKVVDVVKNAKPESTQFLFSKVPYQYVLEVNAGTVDVKGLQVGDVVELRLGLHQ